ncbi:MAG: YeeE/YedE family protein [Myxococcales bacterium]|nr:YeeE/YedE family protein [Myxococcales bacterium]MCB9718468.1 YeeE/YedE family protein [Myxococcales bacterium]
MGRQLAALVSGLLFSAGLLIGGMTDPMKVVGFLDFTGDWDPSLAFVMGGAILVYGPLFRLVSRRPRPRFDTKFFLPTRRDIDLRLLVGAALFGVGWGLGGFCPGPALVSTMSLSTEAITFAGSMLVGMAGFQLWTRVRGHRAQK